MTSGASQGDQLGATRSGVYRAIDARMAPAARAAGFDVTTISLSRVVGKDALFDRFAAALAFPEWFGANWDALQDCLSDLSWREGRGQLLVIDGFEALQAASPDDCDVLLDVLAESANHWLWQERPFFAVFVDPGRVLRLPTWDDETA